MAVILVAPEDDSMARVEEGDTGAIPFCPLPRRTLIRKLIVEGSDELASQVYRRLCADRLTGFGDSSEDAPSWTAIARRAKIEGLLDREAD